MDKQQDWIRWAGVFLLVSIGITLFLGLKSSLEDSSPLGFLAGFFISVTLFVVAPGLILGGIVSLATEKSRLGLRLMIITNAVSTIVVIYGYLIQFRP
jgi:hypothetical protein